MESKKFNACFVLQIFDLRMAIAIFLVTLVSGCEMEKNKEVKQRIFDLLDIYNLQHNSSTSFYFFIPLDGCGECVKTSIDFVNSNFHLDNVSFVLTSQVKKNFKIFIKEDIIHRENIIIDEKQMAKIFELVSIKPIIYVFNNGNVENIFELDDQNSKMVLSTLFVEL
jgi:hypothetical protein